MNNINIFSTEILLMIFSFILPKKITLSFYYDYFNIKHTCKLQLLICDKYYKRNQINYYLMKKYISHNHKPPIFLDYKLKKKLKKHYEFYLISKVERKKEKSKQITKIILIIYS